MKIVADKARKGEKIEMELPNVGILIVKNGIAAVSFQDYLLEET